MENYIITRSYKQTIVYILYALIALLACVFLLYVCYSGNFEPNGRIGRNYYLAIIVSWLGILIAIVGLIWSIYFMITKPIVLKLDEHGLEDHSAIMSLGFISWKDVDDIVIVTFVSKKWIGVALHTDSNMIRLAPLYKRMLIKANMKMGVPPIVINLDQTNAKLEEVIKVMKKFHEASKSKS